MSTFRLFDTAESGNRNRGHEIGSGYDASRGDQQVGPGLMSSPLTHGERLAIITHLTVRDDERDGPEEPYLREPTCHLLQGVPVGK